MKYFQAPYVFSACQDEQALSCNRANFFSDNKCKMNPYARAYVVPQAYANCSSPECSLQQGTFFKDLYMPYTPKPRMKNC